MRFHIALAILLLATTAHAQVVAKTDTTIKGQTYAKINATDFITALRSAKAGTNLEYRRIAIDGPVFAPTARLDTVHASLSLIDVNFLGEVVLNNVVFTADLRGEKIEFRRGLSALKARFNANFALRQSISRRHTSFKQALFAAESDFSNSAFQQTTSFIETHFAQAIFSHARFASEVYFERSVFAAESDFKDAFFEGNAHFKNVHFKSDIHFGGARFIQRTRFWQSTFSGPSTFDNARSRGEISFGQTVFDQKARFRHITFVHPVSFAGAVFHQPVTFSGSHFKKAADFSGVRFHADLDLNADFKSALDLRHSRGPSLDLLPANNKGYGTKPDSTLTDTARLYLQQANFSRIAFRWPQVAGRLASADSTGADLQPVYAKLHHHLIAEGLASDARSCFAAAMEHKLRYLDPTQIAWHGLQLWRLTTYYGTDLFRLVVFIFACLILFGLLYRLIPGHPIGIADCLYHSALSFFHLGLRSETQGLAGWLSLAQTLIGWICLGLFIATISGLR